MKRILRYIRCIFDPKFRRRALTVRSIKAYWVGPGDGDNVTELEIWKHDRELESLDHM